MSNENIFYSSDLSNKDHTGLFDRIINIKFTRKNGKTFTIHSDYEPVWNNGVMYFKTCQPKPEIRVTYTQYSATLINVDIFVTNLNIIEGLDAKTKAAGEYIGATIDSIKRGADTNLADDTLTAKGNVIVRAEIEMGYRGDFYNWSRYQEAGVTPEVAWEAYQNLEGLDGRGYTILDSQQMFKKHRRCTVAVAWAAHINNPPDRVTQYHGFVGTTEAGFQLYMQSALDSPTKEGATGKITKHDLHKSLDDTYDTIDDMPIERAGDLGFGRLFGQTGTTYRNFFNGGNSFTLLEALCFNLVTRRFVRTNVNVTRNENLEAAFLDLSLTSDFGGIAAESMQKFQAEIRQTVYKKEALYYPDYFKTGTTGQLVPSDTIPAKFNAYIEKTITAELVTRYIGSRYTIKSLPHYRRMYQDIRKALKASYEKGIYMSWWQAVERSTPPPTYDKTISYEGIAFEDTVVSLKRYVSQMQEGKFKDSNAAIRRPLGPDDWIIPMERISSPVQMADAKGKKVEVTVDGKKQPVSCFSGCFEVRDAYLFGAPVLCSAEASRIVQEKNESKNFVEMQFHSQPHIQVAWICRIYGLLYYKKHNGGFFIYAASEDAASIAKEKFITQQSGRPVRIPAIYDMSLSPMRKMRLPFIGFLDPKTLIEWDSSTSIGSIKSFYYQPAKGKNFFVAISTDIDFSTTGSTNMMELNLMDAQYTDKAVVPKALASQDKKDSEKNVYTDVLILIEDGQMDTWRKIYESPMGVIPPALVALWDPSISDMTKQYTVSKNVFFTLMKSWNDALFKLSTEVAGGWASADGKKRVDKTANWLYRPSETDKKINFPEISYCMTLAELDPKLKRIFMKFPFMKTEADYTSETMKEVDVDRILVYTAGEWSMQLKTDMKKTYTIVKG